MNLEKVGILYTLPPNYQKKTDAIDLNVLFYTEEVFFLLPDDLRFNPAPILNSISQDLKSPKILPYSLPKMKMSISRLNLFMLFFHLLILQFSPRISAIRYIFYFSVFCFQYNFGSSLWLLRKQRKWGQKVESCGNAACVLFYVLLNFES